jgi:hypothetical protein
MSISHKLLGAAAALCFVGAITAGSLQAQPLVASQQKSIWWEPGNGGAAGGTLTGWSNLFDLSNTAWPNTAGATSHLMLRDNVMRKQPVGWVAQTLAPFVKSRGMAVELDSAAATEWTCDGGHNAVLRSDVALIEAMQNAGITVDYVSVQNTLSRQNGMTAYASGNPCYPVYTLVQRAGDVAAYVNAVKASLAADGYKTPKFMLTDSNLSRDVTWLAATYGTTDLYAVMTNAFAVMGAASPSVHLDALKIDVGVEAYCLSGDATICANKRHPDIVMPSDLANFSSWLAQKGILPVVELAVNSPTSGQDVISKVNNLLQMIESTPGINLRDFQLCLFKPAPDPTTYVSERNTASETYLLSQMSASLSAWTPQ